MSGFKRATITIGQEEYDRLRDAEIRLRTVPEISQQANQQIRQQYAQALQSNVQQFQERQTRYEQALAGMADYVRDLESQTAQALVDYQTNTLQDVQQYAGRLWSHYDEIITEQSNLFETQIEAAHHQYQRELSMLSRRMRKMAGSSTRKREIAASWLADATRLADFIRENYATQQFFPERMARLEIQLEQAQANLANGLAEAVVVATQQLYTAFSDLRLDLEKAEQEWHFLYDTTREVVQQLHALVIESQQVEAIDLDGNPLPFMVDVRYWAPNRLEQLYAELDQREQDLIEQPEQFTSAMLRDWLYQDLPVLQTTFEMILLDARVNALNSQLRINIADLVVRALQDQGFRLSEADYETEDMREAFDARLVNLEGNEVLVSVAPTGQELGNNELRLQSLDSENHTEQELQQRWYEISRSLNYYGLEVGRFATTNRQTRAEVPVLQSGKPAGQTSQRVTPQRLSQPQGVGSIRNGN